MGNPDLSCISSAVNCLFITASLTFWPTFSVLFSCLSGGPPFILTVTNLTFLVFTRTSTKAACFSVLYSLIISETTFNISCMSALGLCHIFDIPRTFSVHPFLGTVVFVVMMFLVSTLYTCKQYF